MPIIASAKKKMRQDEKRHDFNVKIKDAFKQAIKELRKTPSTGNMSKAFSALDSAAKKHVIHPNKASRLKSRLAKIKTTWYY